MVDFRCRTCGFAEGILTQSEGIRLFGKGVKNKYTVCMYISNPYAVRTGGKGGKDNGKGIQPPDIQPPLPPVPPPPVAPVSSAAATSATSASSPTCRICLQAPGEDRVKDLEARLTVLEDQVKDLEARLKNAGSLQQCLQVAF